MKRKRKKKKQKKQDVRLENGGLYDIAIQELRYWIAWISAEESLQRLCCHHVQSRHGTAHRRTWLLNRKPSQNGPISRRVCRKRAYIADVKGNANGLFLASFSSLLVFILIVRPYTGTNNTADVFRLRHLVHSCSRMYDTTATCCGLISDGKFFSTRRCTIVIFPLDRRKYKRKKR
jgi:hypothetical protein